MKIAITGGTGTLGSLVAAELSRRGHEVLALSRRSSEHPVDLRTGEGLPAALAGCHIVVDASNDNSSQVAETLVAGSRRLLAAEEAAGVVHHIAVSIVGCEKIPMAYFRAKAQQEQVAQEGRVPWSLVRATQFHELVAATFAGIARYGVMPIPEARLRSIACREVAVTIADLAEGAPLGGAIEVAGPEIDTARDLAHSWISLTGRRALLLPVPLPGKIGQALRAGALVAVHPDLLGTTTFTEWLKQRR